MPATRKKRIRRHVIADLSVNHLAYHVLKAGFTLEVWSRDYGYDGFISFYDPNGEVENGLVYVQLKATDSIGSATRRKHLSFPVKTADVDLWCNEAFPVYLFLFDARAERAYWVYFQQYCELNGITTSGISTASLTIRIDIANIVETSTPQIWRIDKQKFFNKIQGVISHV